MRSIIRFSFPDECSSPRVDAVPKRHAPTHGLRAAPGNEGSKMINLLSHLSHVEITSPDVEASVEFYEEQVGLRVVDRDRRQGLPALLGRLLRTTASSSPGDRAVAGHDGVAHHQPRGPRRGRAARRGRRHAGEWSEPAPAAAARTVHGPVGPHDRPRTGTSSSTRPTTRRVDLPRPPRERSERRRRAAPARPRHDRRMRRHGVRAWYHDVLGFRIMAYTELDEAPITVFSVMTTNEKSHDLGVVLDSSSARAASTTTRSGSTPARSC